MFDHLFDQGLPESKITFTPTSLDVMLLEATCTAHGSIMFYLLLYYVVLALSLSLYVHTCIKHKHTCYFVFICSPIEKHFWCFVRHFLWRDTKGT